MVMPRLKRSHLFTQSRSGINATLLQVRAPLRNFNIHRIVGASSDTFALELPDSRYVNPGERFWSSFAKRFHLDRNIFTYFQPHEVMERLRRQHGSDEVNVTVELNRADGFEGDALACVDGDAACFTAAEMQDLVTRHKGVGLCYGQGIMHARFDTPFQTGAKLRDSDFKTQFLLELPVDGYGAPTVSLGLLRMVCSNGMMALTDAFRSGIQLGKTRGRGAKRLDPVQALDKALSTFHDEEGYHALRTRVTAAQESYASLDEARQLGKRMTNALRADPCSAEEMERMQRSFTELLGEDVVRRYGMSTDKSSHAASPRAARLLPTRASVYDLLNFSSELATHKFKKPQAQREFGSWQGEILAREYDLEGTLASGLPDYRDVFFK